MLPGHLRKERGDRDGNIGQHEDRERNNIQDLFPGGSVNVAPFRDRRDDTEDEHHRVRPEKRPDDKPDRMAERAPDLEQRHESTDHSDNVDRQDHERKDHSRHDRHRHIEAGEVRSRFRLAATPAEDPLYQFQPVMSVNLKVSATPAQTLVPGLTELCRLFVVEMSGAAISHPDAGEYVHSRKLDVLGEQKILPFEFPVLARRDRRSVEQEPGTGDRAARSEHHSRSVQISRFAQEPESVARGYPVVSVVL